MLPPVAPPAPIVPPVLVPPLARVPPVLVRVPPVVALVPPVLGGAPPVLVGAPPVPPLPSSVEQAARIPKRLPKTQKTEAVRKVMIGLQSLGSGK
jgi:hypothetical protein